jgi:RNA polymerase sigma-70 factor (ECF subfamily)
MTTRPAATRRDEHERLKQALDRLPEHYRQVVVWHLYVHWTFADIGQRLSCSAGAAKQIWLRALQHLARHLSERRH